MKIIPPKERAKGGKENQDVAKERGNLIRGRRLDHHFKKRAGWEKRFLQQMARLFIQSPSF